MQRIFLFITISYMLTLAACTPSQPRLVPLLQGDTIVAFGNSLTYGVGAKPSQSYPKVLSRLIHHPVINAGIPGDTTESGLKRLPAVLNRYHPALVILALGGNDLLRKRPKAKIEASLQRMILFIKHDHAQVILLAPPRPNLSLKAPKFYKKLGKEMQVPVNMTLLPNLLFKQQYKSDAIHLNAQGYKKLAEGIANMLTSYGAILP